MKQVVELVSMERITRPVALSMLAGNASNRAIDMDHVGWLVAQLRLGQWKEQGRIVIGLQGELQDGQHRLVAAYIANVDCWMSVGRQKLVG